MSLLESVLSAHRCTSTHHKLILDAVARLSGDKAEAWQRVFLKNAEPLLAGAKAPDSTFKDFRNHVLHVREKLWGGAVELTETWYKHTVDSLRAQNWVKASYAAGVLSHYYSDPLMPLHTAQSEEEGIVHRACERSVFRCYDQLKAILERDLGGFPEVQVGSGNRWLAEMVKSGARRANEHYDLLIDHYNIAKGVSNPAAGLDDELRVKLAECIGYAVVGIARILDAAIAESGVTPPNAGIMIAGVSAWIRKPTLRWAKFRANARDKRVVKAIYKEYRKTGKVIAALPEDEKSVRKLHAEEVLNTTPEKLDAIKPRAVGAKYGKGTYLRPAAVAAPTATPKVVEAPRIAAETNARPAVEQPAMQSIKPSPRFVKFHLDPSSAIVDAPSIGQRTAEKMIGIGIKTVGEFLAMKPDQVANKLKLGHVKSDDIREWQIQARLACRIPNMRAVDVKILTGCGIWEPEDLAKSEPLELLDRVDLFVSTSEGRRALRGGDEPDLDVVTEWIASANSARALKAA